MKRLVTLLMLVMMCVSVMHAQTVIVLSETFNGNTHSFTSTPGTAWQQSSIAAMSDSKFIWSSVPSLNGDSVILTSPICDFSSHANVVVRFRHICKVSPVDEVRFEYRLDAVGSYGAWRPVPASAYKGTAANYSTTGFNAASYEAWKVNDSLATPNASWWMEESFDLTDQVSLDRAQFRFIIKKGTVQGSNISYGWLIDNFQALGSSVPMVNPVVEFVSPFTKDTVYNTGPFTIRAKVATRTISPIVAPYLVYTSTLNNVTSTDSVLMTAYSGDSLWEATLPQFLAGTSVSYSVMGRDTSGNYANAISGYYIKHIVSSGSYAGLHVIGDTSTTNYTVWGSPTGDGDGPYQWCRMLYRSYEMPSVATLITDIAFRVAWEYRDVPLTGQTVYMRLVNDTVIPSEYYESPASAQLVWTGTVPVLSDNAWLKVHMDAPFVYQPGMSLLIYWESRSPQSNNWNGMDFYGDQRYDYNTHTCVYYGEESFNTGAMGWWNARPSIVYTMENLNYGDNSAALTTINSPRQDSAFAGATTPVRVTIRNKGDMPLSSVQINWSVNGVLQTPYNYQIPTALPWDFQSEVAIGSYVVSTNAFDTIVVWITNPNGKQDSVTLDDTMEVYIYGCDAPLAGTYTVGSGEDFNTLSEAIIISNLCGASADVVFEVKSGTYTETLDMSNLGHNYKNNHLTITSATGNAADVVYNISEPVKVENVRNFTLANITFNAGTKSVMNITGAEESEVYGCELICDTTRSDNFSNVSVNSSNYMRFHHNHVNGGYSGLSCGGNKNTLIDSNIIENFYYYGANLSNTDIAFDANQIYSRINNAYSYNYFIYSYYANGSITNNKIWQRSNAINYPYGIYSYYMNYKDSVNRGLIANNEISISTGSSYYGMYLYLGVIDVLHNSVHVNSSSGRAIYVSDNANNDMEIAGNDLVCQGGYPIYLSAVTNMNRLNIHGNNHVGIAAGYAGGDYSDVQSWGAMFNDNTAISVDPTYIDSTVNLKWSDYTGATVKFHNKVLTDKEGNPRGTTTGIGAYQGVDIPDADGTLFELVGLQEGMVSGLTDTAKVVLFNGGNNALTSATINWSINGVAQSPIAWTGRLNILESDTISLGAITYTIGKLNVQAYISSLAAGQTDEDHTNDTISQEFFICAPGGMNGTYVIPGNEFVSVAEGISRLASCGMSGNVTLMVKPGTYTGNIDFANSKTYSNGYHITLTSYDTNDKAQLTAGGKVINFAQSENVEVSYLVIDGGKAYGIQFNDTCKNISIHHCDILCDETGTSSACAPIYKTSTGKWVDSVAFAHNNIVGGYYGIYFYGGSASNSHGTRIIFDSNNCINQYYYATYFYYANFSSCSGNTFISRTANSTTYWYGLRLYYCNGKFVNNNVRTANPGITYAYGIYAYYMNTTDNANNDSCLIANNDILFNPCGQFGTAIYVGSYNGEILHNSCRKISASGGNYGIYVTGTSNLLRIKNNNLDGNWAYCIDLARNFTASTDDIDANNMRSGNGTIVAYANGATRTLATWKTIVTSDKTSVTVNPNYLSSNTTYLKDSIGLGVNTLPQVLFDKDGVSRGVRTNMGAYHFYVRPVDANPVAFVDMMGGYNTGTSVPVKVAIVNSGSNTLTSLNINTVINDGAVKTYHWTGSLAGNAMDTVTIDTFMVTSDLYKVKVYTDMPNNAADMFTMNDTIETTVMRCSGSMSGVYTIGTGSAYDYQDLATAWQAAINCGVSGNVTFQLDEDMDISDFKPTTIPGTSSSRRITITSVPGKKVTLTAASSPVLELSGLSYVTFRNLNISDGTQGVVVKFAGICQYITIDSCNIYGKPTTTNTADRTIEAYFSSSTSNRLSNVIISNNLINGGYANIYFYYSAGSNSYMRNTYGNEITGNTMSNAYYYGLYSYYYTYYRKLNNNTVTSRSNSGTFYGLYLYYYHTMEQVMNNKVYANGSSTVYGIYSYYYINYNSSYGASGPGLMANNEVVVKSTGSSVYGIYTGSYTNLNVYNNSVYAKGTTSYAMYNSGSVSGYPVHVIGNNLIADKNNASDTTYKAYTYYRSSASYATASYGTVDYNNYYSVTGPYLAYLGTPKATLADMQAYQDANSYNVNPHFADVNSSLVMPDSVVLTCPVQNGVDEDIRGMVRSGVTNVGAYGLPPKQLDMALATLEIPSNTAGVSLQPVLGYTNVGYDSISSFTCDVYYNGVLKNSSLTINCNIPFLGKGLFYLPTFTLTAGRNDVKVYITGVNGMGLDSSQANDTITASIFACTGRMNGTYVIGTGAGADFATIADFDEAIKSCMVNGAITMAFQNGTYNEPLNVGEWSSLLNGYALTIQSVSGDSSLVVISDPGSALILNNNRNVTVKNVTLLSLGGTTVNIGISCSNIYITHCQILNDTAITATSYCVYKSSNSSTLTNFTLSNCLVEGAYYGLYLYSGTSSSAYGSGIRIDSNVIRKQYYYGAYSYYTSYTSFSHNTVEARDTIATNYWYGIYCNYANGSITCNSVQKHNPAITSGYCIYLNYMGYYNTSVAQLVANNVVSACGTGSTYGMYVYYSHVNLYNNSIRINGSASGRALYVSTSSTLEVKNNIFDGGQGNAIYTTVPFSSDYNNLYTTGSDLAYMGTTISDLATWQSVIHGDTNSVSIAPQYKDTISLTLNNDADYVCPAVSAVSADIDGNIRYSVTGMGAHTLDIPTLDVAAVEMDNYPAELISGQTLPVSMRIMNLGATTITSANIGWSINGVNQPAYNWTAAPSVGVYNEAVISFGSFTAPASGNVEVKAWINYVNNNLVNDNVSNDTVSAIGVVSPLAAFTYPFVGDTTYGLSFDIYTKILEGTGATISNPVMTIVCSMDGNVTAYDTLAMTRDHDNVWIASVPQQYYGTTVVYSTTISDTLNNTVTLIDTTYLQFGTGLDSVVIGTAPFTTRYYTPINTFYNYSWSRQIYKGDELREGAVGGLITELSWDYAYNVNVTYSNQICYFMATDDSIVDANYMDPVNAGATQVWRGSIVFKQGWCKVVLDQPFMLPAGKNLMVIWHNNNGTYPGTSYVFNNHNTTYNSTSYAQSDASFPQSSGTLTNYRPNAKFTIGTPFEPYQQTDMAVTSVVEPIRGDELCGTDYTSVKVALGNLSDATFNYAADSITVHMAITTPIQYTASVTISTGTLASGEFDTVEIESALPVIKSGIYDMKFWINSVDGIPSDDTLYYDYTSYRLNLPLDENFANGMPVSFHVEDNNTAAGWEVVYDSSASGKVIPATGNAMIAFDGSRGAMSRLYSQQLDFSGTSQPLIDFWYYHDTAATASTADYTDVRLTFDGGETFTTLFSVRKNNGNDVGWRQYTYPLDSFVNQSCVILVFEAMRMSQDNYDGEQYIDRIRLLSNQDLAVGAIQTSELSACSYTGKELQVVLSCLTGQAVDFSKYPTSLVVTVSGAVTANYNIPLNSGTVPALDNDTIVVDNNFDFIPGTYNVKAWLGSSIDKVLTNDTLTQSIVVNPTLTVAAQQVTGGNDATNCIGIGTQVNQVVTVTNSGNMDMEDIELTMNIYDINGVLTNTYTDTISGLLAVNDSVVKTFAEAYTVPDDEMYTVEVVANPACNTALTYNNVITECVDQNDIEVVSILYPENGVAQGSSAKVTVRVANNNPNEDAQGVVLHVIVANADGSEIANWTETLNDISAGEYTDYEFPQSFTVPAADNFTVTAFVNNIDTKASNDTLVATIATNVAVNEADANGMSLSQNVPNPANSHAVVSYSIPEDGSVVFTILTVTGQVLHTQSTEALAGKNSIEFNTENLASGVYFYTMDFQGQRLVKKMVIKK